MSAFHSEREAAGKGTRLESQVYRGLCLEAPGGLLGLVLETESSAHSFCDLD